MKFVSRSHFWLLIGLLMADIVLFGVGNPHSAASWVLIIGFLLLAVNFYVLMLGLLRLASWYGLSLSRHRQRVARIATGVFGGLVALQSIGQLSPHDPLMLVPLVILAYLYLSYGSRKSAASAPSP